MDKHILCYVYFWTNFTVDTHRLTFLSGSVRSRTFINLCVLFVFERELTLTRELECFDEATEKNCCPISNTVDTIE